MGLPWALPTGVQFQCSLAVMEIVHPTWLLETIRGYGMMHPAITGSTRSASLPQPLPLRKPWLILWWNRGQPGLKPRHIVKPGEADWRSLILRRRMKISKQNCRIFENNVGLDLGKRLITSGSTLMGLPWALPTGVQFQSSQAVMEIVQPTWLMETIRGYGMMHTAIAGTTQSVSLPHPLYLRKLRRLLWWSRG